MSNRTVTEEEMLQMLRSSKRVFLLEPKYKRKYMPLGLAKIATYVKEHGGEVEFGRSYNGEACDLICITTLFTYDSIKVHEAVMESTFLAPNTPVLIGGIYSTLMPNHVPEYPTVNLFPAYSKELDLRIPDFSVDWQLDERWIGFSDVYTTRGCPNRCKFCAVWRIEPDQWIHPSWKEHIVDHKPYTMISDNNLSAFPWEHMSEVLDYVVEKDKRVLFNNGFDCKHITPEMAVKLGKIKYIEWGARIGFDRIEEDEQFQTAIRLMLDAGVPAGQILVFVLFNFLDTPQEAHYRMKVCLDLKLRPYPMRFAPLNQTTRKNVYVGKHWTRKLVQAFRTYWLMGGFYRKLTFEEYGNDPNKCPVELTEEDWAAWNYK